MSSKCIVCGEKMVTRAYPTTEAGVLRLLSHCGKKVLHTYSAETLGNIDYKKIQRFIESIPEHTEAQVA